MRRRLTITLVLLAALAQIVLLIVLLRDDAPPPSLPLIEAPPEVIAPPPEDDLRAKREHGTLRGKVINGVTGEAIRGAKVIALAPYLEKKKDDDVPFWGEMMERASVVTDERGTFALEALPPDYWNLWVERRGYAWASVPRAKFADEQLIRLYPECSITGKLVYPDDTPASDVHIEYTPQGTESEVFSRYKLKSFYIRTRQDGTFEYRGLIPGPFTVEAYPEGHLPAPWIHEPPLLPGENRVLPTHKLDAGFGLTVKVVWRGSGAPVPGIEVAVRPVGDPMPRTKAGRRVRTDAEGIARFGGLGGQVLERPKFTVAANVPGMGPVTPDERQFFEAGETATIRLRPGGSVNGKVLRPNGEPLEYFHVELLPKGFLTQQLRAGGTNGEFAIYQVPEGTYTLAVRYGNLVDREVEVSVEGGKATDAGTLTLDEGAEIYGTVAREDGAPIEDGVRVHLARKVFHPTLKRDEYVAVKRAICKPDGTYRIRGVPEGEFWIWPEPSRVSGTTPPRLVSIQPGVGALALDLMIHGTGYLRFVFFDEIDGQRRQVVQPPVHLVHGGSGEETRWLSEGTPLRPGVYEVWVEMPGRDGVPHRYKAPSVQVQEGKKSDPIEVRLFEIRNDE